MKITIEQKDDGFFQVIIQEGEAGIAIPKNSTHYQTLDGVNVIETVVNFILKAREVKSKAEM